MSHPGNQKKVNRHFRLVAWLLLPFFAIPCLAVKHSWDAEHRADLAVYRQKESQHQRDCQRIRNNLFALGLNGQPIDVVLERLNLPDNLPLEGYPNGYHFSGEIDYLQGSQIVLGFNPEHHLESLTLFGPYFEDPYPSKPMARTQDDIGQFGDQLAGSSVPFVVWLFFAVIYCTSRDGFVPLWLLSALVVFQQPFG